MYDKHYLTALFEPRSVAVVGATEREGAVASIVLKNLLATKYRGHLFAVNPHRAAVYGVPSFPALEAVPERIDLAVVVTPAATVPQVIEDAGRAGVHEWQMPDGARMTIRPIRPEDAELEREFVKGLSPESKYFRFMDTLRELTPQMLARFTQIDYDREMAFVAVAHGGGKEAEAGVCRYITNPDGESCEFAVVIADAWQGRGIAGRLMAELIAVAREKRLKRMVGHVLASNSRMLKFVEGLGFTLSYDPSDPTVKRAVLALQPR